jgi:hypothetical protein
MSRTVPKEGTLHWNCIFDIIWSLTRRAHCVSKGMWKQSSGSNGCSPPSWLGHSSPRFSLELGCHRGMLWSISSQPGNSSGPPGLCACPSVKSSAGSSPREVFYEFRSGTGQLVQVILSGLPLMLYGSTLSCWRKLLHHPLLKWCSRRVTECVWWRLQWAVESCRQ